MKMICLDVEGVLLPEIWIGLAEKSGIPELRRTTRDEPDYDKLMRSRLAILKENRLGIRDIQNVIAGLDPLPGAAEFLDGLRSRSQVILLSDTFEEFARPLMKKLSWPTIFCNSLRLDADGTITDYVLRLKDGKTRTVEGLAALNFDVTAAGDSYNDLGMIRAAKRGALFCPPRKIIDDNPDLAVFNEYEPFSRFLLEEA